jgi:glycosyltransferase involved in cell wall biosynthesis
MSPNKPVVQIGPISEDPAESVSAVNKSLIQGLSEKFQFEPVLERRKFGATRQSGFNAVNGYYFVKHFFFWVLRLVTSRPKIAHYAVSSGWAMEKGLIFLAVARWLGVKTVGHMHAGDFMTHWESLAPKRRKWAFRQLEKMDAVIVLSESWREDFASKIGVAREKLFVVNNPIDSEFEKAALEMPIEKPSTTILALGVMGRAKGLWEILEAAKGVPRVNASRILLVGPERDANVYKDIETFVAGNSLRELVEVKGSVRGAGKIELFRQASVFLLPSYFENFPLVVLEAAAAGLAIVSTPVGATPEFFKDGASAIFVEPQNSDQIRSALTRLIENPEECHRLGRAAREVFCTRLARAPIMTALDQTYQHVLNA